MLARRVGNSSLLSYSFALLIAAARQSNPTETPVSEDAFLSNLSLFAEGLP